MFIPSCNKWKIASLQGLRFNSAAPRITVNLLGLTTEAALAKPAGKVRTAGLQR